MRGTAILTRDGISLENVSLLPTGRANAEKFRDIRIINVDAPLEGRRNRNANYSTTVRCPTYQPPGTHYWVVTSIVSWALQAQVVDIISVGH
jgi:hypothetical protein